MSIVCLPDYVRLRILYLCESARVCVCAPLAMPVCHSDLPITRSIKPLIPKIHASNSTTPKEEKNTPISLKEKMAESSLLLRA